MGARERLPVGHVDVRVRGEGRPARGAEWLRENDCPWSEWTCASAAEYGQLEVLKWLRENDCPWGTSTCAYAALGGHLEVLKWLRENGCPLDRGDARSQPRYVGP